MDDIPLEKFELTVWWVLNQLQEQIYLQIISDLLVTTVISIDIEELKIKDQDSPSISDIRHTIMGMERTWGILEVLSRRRHTHDGLTKPEKYWPRATCFILRIEEEKFNKFYQRYKRKFDLIEKDKLFFSKSGATVFRCGGREYKASFTPKTNLYKALYLIASKRPEVINFESIDNVLGNKKLNADSSAEVRARQVIKDIKKKLKYKGKKLFHADCGFSLVPEFQITSENL